MLRRKRNKSGKQRPRGFIHATLMLCSLCDSFIASRFSRERLVYVIIERRTRALYAANVMIRSLPFGSSIFTLLLYFAASCIKKSGNSINLISFASNNEKSCDPELCAKQQRDINQIALFFEEMGKGHRHPKLCR
jgi:hypothetical protein